MSELYWLTDEQMARLSPYFSKSHGNPIRPMLYRVLLRPRLGRNRALLALINES